MTLQTGPGTRLIAIDWLRTLALVNMAAFHFLFDLRMFGLVPDWLSLGQWFADWAKIMAGGFLALAGLSLHLAHAGTFAVRAFLGRLGILCAAAATVSLVTYFAVPDAWIRFGILHSIAACSVLGLMFLRTHPAVTLLAAALVFYVLPHLRHVAFDGAAWIWTGLSTSLPPMIDYEPMVPWLAPFLLGLAFGQLNGVRFLRWGSRRAGRLSRAIAWPGRHSLAFYLLHQPILLAGVGGYAWLTDRLS